MALLKAGRQENTEAATTGLSIEISTMRVLFSQKQEGIFTLDIAERGPTRGQASGENSRWCLNTGKYGGERLVKTLNLPERWLFRGNTSFTKRKCSFLISLGTEVAHKCNGTKL